MKVKTYNFKISVKQNLVDDGLELTEEKMLDILTNYFPFTYQNEFDVKQTKRPKKEEI